MNAKVPPWLSKRRFCKSCTVGMLPLLLLGIMAGCTGYDPEIMAMHGAIERADLAEVRRLVEQGVSVEITDSRGRTPLYLASLYSQLDIVRYLLDQDADPKRGVSWKAERLPIHAAAQVGADKIVKIFLDRGVDANVTDDTGKTPLHEAAWDLHTSTVALLISRGASVNVRNIGGYPAMMRQFPRKIMPDKFPGYLTIVRILTENGADVNAVDSRWGMTPLIYAAFIGDLDTVTFLLANGADPSIKSRIIEGGTALNIAKREGHKEIVALLERHQRTGEGNSL